jgi:16S rRNA (guanine527-N7)-methyltransferase
MKSPDFNNRLSRRACKAGVPLTEELIHGLEIYYRLLALWSEKINLTGIDLSVPTDEGFDRLLIEPLAAGRHYQKPEAMVLDIGSGGGSPAIPMALGMKDSSLVMVESKFRKSVFLREVVRELGLDRAQVVNSRFEALKTRPDLREAKDLVTIRAVKLDARALTILQTFLLPGGNLFLFCGESGFPTYQSAVPPFTRVTTHKLLDSLGSQLVVLQKPIP